MISVQVRKNNNYIDFNKNGYYLVQKPLIIKTIYTKMNKIVYPKLFHEKKYFNSQKNTSCSFLVKK